MNILTKDEILDAFGETANEYILNRVQRLTEVAKAQHRETLKMVLDIVNKHWAGYCDFEDKRACLEILENIHDGIEALTQLSEGDCDNCDGIGSLLDCTYADSNTSPPCPNCNGTGKSSKTLKQLIEEAQNE